MARNGASGRSVLERTATGVGWILGWRMATRVLGLLSTMILVRLLLPADFGLVALGTTFIIAVDTLSALGVEEALVREHAPTPAMYDTAFTLNVLRSLATAMLIAAAAIPASRFFAEARLADILWALAAGTVISGLGNIGAVDFRRDMAFEKEFLLQILPRVVSIIVTIATALTWHSYWALVSGILTGRTLRTLLSYRMHRWRPRFTLAAWRELIGFSLWTWAGSLAQLVRDRMDTFVVSRIMGPEALGVYAIGEEIASLPTGEVVLPVGRACFSGFAAARSAGHDMSDTFMRPVATAFLVTLPAGLGISLVADPLVRLFVGEKWIAAIPIIQLLGVMGALSVFGIIATTLLTAHAVMREQFVVMVSCLALRLVLLIPLVDHFGALGAAAGNFSAMLCEHSLFLVLAFRRFDLRAADLLRRVWRTLAAALIMAVVLVATGLGWTHVTGDAGLVLRSIVAAVAMGAGTYALALLVLWHLAGRPRGAEADMLVFAHRLVRSATRVFSRISPAASATG